MIRITFRDSLGWRASVALVAVEVGFAVILSVTMAGFTAVDAARHRRDSIHQVSEIFAAALMPVVADQENAQVQAQLESMLSATHMEGVASIRLVDSSGSLIASTDTSPSPLPDRPPRDDGPLSLLLREQVVERPIVVDQSQVATVYIVFAPVALNESLRAPVLAAILVLTLVVLVSGPWTAWVFMRGVGEPLNDLSRHASAVADGRLNAVPPTGAAGEIGVLQETLSRMTRQLKEREGRLSASNADLVRVCDELERAKKDVEQLAAMKADFVAVAAHEIRGPLAAISVYAELLAADATDSLEGGSAEAIDSIGSSCARLASIVSDLMDSALLERGMMPIKFEQVHLGEILDGAVRGAQLLARPRGIAVRLDDEIADTVIRADGLRLRQVLDNLLSNALKYSPAGSNVVVRSSRTPDFIDIEVADEGMGVSKTDRGVLFTLFGRGDTGDGRETAGLGLGLAISARIMEAHGGGLTFRENEAGRGSVFRMRLPRTGVGAADMKPMMSIVKENRHARG